MDISSLRDRKGDGIMTVSELNGYIKNMFDNSRLLSSVSVVGEISNFTNHRSGHLYFSIKDEQGQIKAVMFRSSAMNLKFMPENGMRVIVHGSVSVYTRDGAYQLYVSTMQPDGIGALYLAYEQLKEKLDREGLFSNEYKKPIPSFPRAIGIITSPTGAAVRDIINVSTRRYKSVKLYIYPAVVQGERSAESLIEAVDYFDKSGLVDTVIIGRGGGSIEDLWSFNSEKLARRIFEANIPIISAVGHETDFTICDFVSDLRAPTPSAAAELAVPDSREILQRLDSILSRCDAMLNSLISRKKDKLEYILTSSKLLSPKTVTASFKETLENCSEKILQLFSSSVRLSRSQLNAVCGKVNALSPLSVLSRGYSIVEKGGKAVKNSSEVALGDTLSVVFERGSIVAKVKEIKE